MGKSHGLLSKSQSTAAAMLTENALVRSYHKSYVETSTAHNHDHITKVDSDLRAVYDCRYEMNRRI